MITYTHQIADIIFKTEVDHAIDIFKNNSYRKFSITDAIPDVYHRFVSISPETFVLPPLSDQELELISQCIIPNYLGRGNLILPPILDSSANIEQYLNKGNGSPLLTSPVVRSRLITCLRHPERTGLLQHVFSVTITDYKNKEIDLFYLSNLTYLLADSRLESGLRRLFTSFLPGFSALLIHSAGVIRGDLAALFLAEDEGGKTTVVKDLARESVFSDDLNIIRENSGTYFVYSSPWGHISNSRSPIKLGGMFLLEKSSIFEILPIDPLDMIEHCWNEFLTFSGFLPKHLKTVAFDLITNICYHIPIYRMRFSKDNVNWNMIDAYLR